MRRYRIESAVYNGLGSATIATPDDEGAWVSAEDALKVEAERDRLATALGAYIEGGQWIRASGVAEHPDTERSTLLDVLLHMGCPTKPGVMRLYCAGCPALKNRSCSIAKALNDRKARPR